MSATEAPTSHLREEPFELARAQLARVAETFGIDPNLVRVLSECKKSIEVSVPVVDGRRLGRGLQRLPRDPQHDARSGEGRHPLPPGGHPGRDQGARDVDDVEVRADGASLRRRQGRRRLRSEAALGRGAGAAHPPLHDRDHQRDRAGEGHPGSRRRYRRAGDGLDLRHVLDERRPLRARRRHGQAAVARGLGGTRRRHRAGRAVLHSHRSAEAGRAPSRHPHRRPGVRERRSQPRPAAVRGGRPDRRAERLEGRCRQPVRDRRAGSDRAQGGARDARTGFRVPSRSRTRS